MRVAGRMLMRARLTHQPVLCRPCGDAADAGQQRLEQVAVLAAAGAPALQQVHLHEVHRVDVGVAQADGALQLWLGVEQRAAALDGEDLFAGEAVLAADVLAEVAQRRRTSSS